MFTNYYIFICFDLYMNDFVYGFNKTNVFKPLRSSGVCSELNNTRHIGPLLLRVNRFVGYVCI